MPLRTKQPLSRASGRSVLPGSWMAAVEDGHVVLPGHRIDCIEEAQEVLFGVDVLLAMGGQKDILPFLESKTLMDVAGLDLCEVLMQHFGHRGSGHISPLLRQAAFGQVAAGML